MNWDVKFTDFQSDFLLSRARFPAMVAGWGTGKRLDINEEIKTTLGWKKLSDIQAGNVIYGTNRNLVTVLVAHEIVVVPKAYRLKFDSGEEILADPEHLWYTIDQKENRQIKRGRRCGGSVKTTEQIIATIRTKNDYESNHRIPVAESLVGNFRELLVKPYTFGAWLGDGNSRCSVITTEDLEILEHIETDGYSVHPCKCRENNNYRISNGKNPKANRKIAGGIFVNDTLTGQLRQLGVYRNKHIPDIYMNASIVQRMELLRGLMDTDGYVDGRGGVCEFTSVNEKLAKQVRELINGLGIKTKKYTGNATINGRFISKKYRICFKTKKEIFKLVRKQERINASTNQQMSRRTNRFIIGYDIKHNVPMRCLTVDSIDGLFLVGRSFIPTHNTLCALAKGCALSAKYPNNLGLVLRKNFTDLKDSTISDFEQYTGVKVKVQSKSVTFPNGSKILFHHADELAGVVQNINLGWFFIEQAEEFDNDEVFEKLGGRLRRKNCFCQGFIIANTNGHNWIWRKWKNDGGQDYICNKKFDISDEGERYNGYASLVEATTFDNIENLKPSFIEALKVKKETAPSHYRRFVLNSWEDVDTADKVIPYQKILDAVDKDLRGYGYDTVVISCDPAEFGDDKTVIFVFKGLKIIDTVILSKKSLMETAGHIMRLHYEHISQAIAIDDIGVGAGVRARLKELNAPVVPINSGRMAEDSVRYTRLRDQMWMHAAQLFRDDYVSIPNDDILIEDLAAFTYGMNSKGQVLVARKKDIKKLIGRSPDRGDALVMGLWVAKKTKKRLPVMTGKMEPKKDWNPLTIGL